MYIVGYVDDELDSIEMYKRRLARHDIDLQFAKDCTSKQDILNWITEKKLKCILIDYKLKEKYDFMGTELVAYINAELPDLTCIIITNYTQASLNENLVVKYLIKERDVLAADDITDFADTIKQAIDVFENRMVQHKKEFINLKGMRDIGTLTEPEEESFFMLYKILRSYDEVDDIPIALLKSDTNQKLDDILARLDSIIDIAR